MLALADPPGTQPQRIHGLKYPPEWHRQMEQHEQALLDAHIRKHMRHRLTPKCC